MSDNHQSIVDIEVHLDDAPALGRKLLSWLQTEQIVVTKPSDCVLGMGYAPGALYAKALREPDSRFLGLLTNGLELITERTVFDAGELGVGLICASCSSRFGDIPGWGEAIGEWYTQTGPGNLRCPQCGAVQPVVEWKHDPVYAFGNLGFKFWNWEPLAEEFVKQVRLQLGHRIVVVEGRL
jgi:hypothetical protein